MSFATTFGVRTSVRRLSETHRRGLATGTRGARGHGWYVNYRAGKGGRHLQGEYLDERSQCHAWNDAIFALCTPKRQVYLDVVVEPRRKQRAPTDSLTGAKHRLMMELADTVMPETCQNFVDLCLANTNGYKGSLLYRFERNVGLCGGDVLTNTGKAGQAAQGSPMAYTVKSDPLVLWHIPGTVTMVVKTVGDIDSRFLMCTEKAPHLDGIQRAFARLSTESLQIVKKWQAKLLTRNGVPSSYDLIVAGCGLVKEENSNSDKEESSPSEQSAA